MGGQAARHPTSPNTTANQRSLCSPASPEYPLFTPAGTRMALLLNCALYWGVPLHYHLPLQAACVALMARFGTVPYCSSKVSAGLGVVERAVVPGSQIPVH